MDRLLQDIRFGWRLLWRSPGFTIAAVLALALGIGATTAIFSVLDRVVLRPLPYPDAERLTMVWEMNDGKGLSHERISPVNFGDYRGLSQIFEDAAAWWYPQVTLTETESISSPCAIGTGAVDIGIAILARNTGAGASPSAGGCPFGLTRNSGVTE